MKIGIAIIISLLAVVALVAEVVLYFFLGLGAALAGGKAAIGGLAFFFVGLMVLTAATAVLAPVGAVVELVVKKANLGAWVLLAGLAIVGTGYVGLSVLSYVMGNHTATTSSAAVTTNPSDRSKTPSSTAPVPLIEVKLLKKVLEKHDYQNWMLFDIEWRASGMKKSARAIKGVLSLQDLFGETKMKVNWTIDKPLAAGAVYVEKETGFKYNQFENDHQWVNSTDLANMKAVFFPTGIIYQDGTTEEIKMIP